LKNFVFFFFLKGKKNRLLIPSRIAIALKN
jgi:hypothetical protein